MLIFEYGGLDENSDRGCWDLAITAPNRRVADQHFDTHVKAKGHAELKAEDCFKRSLMLGRDGLLYSNLETPRDDCQAGC